jgi:hypothetical protein
MIGTTLSEPKAAKSGRVANSFLQVVSVERGAVILGAIERIGVFVQSRFN